MFEGEDGQFDPTPPVSGSRAGHRQPFAQHEVQGLRIRTFLIAPCNGMGLGINNMDIN